MATDEKISIDFLAKECSNSAKIDDVQSEALKTKPKILVCWSPFPCMLNACTKKGLRTLIPRTFRPVHGHVRRNEGVFAGE